MTSHQEDIAIVGIACRFPGEASSPEKFLSMLKNGRDAWSKVPKDRFDISAYHHPSHERQGNIVADGGHFLEEDVGLFDAPFFSMTAAEANAMDPQQRLILESTYECLDSAGIPMESLIGSQTSVYVGCFTRDYEAISARQIDDTLLYQATGQGLAMLSNRLSWFYDLKGPSLTLDTACSSSLLALHLACQSIRSGESTMSIVGGTGLILLPDIMRTLTALHFLSPDSRCYSFDERANGYARGEGIGTLVLKTVSDAIRDGDTIRAVIRGTSTNQDGRTPGITLPSSEAQASLIASTYRAAGLDYRDTQYFEAHGTGTPAGDPLELGALGSTFGKDSERDRPLLVGSVKTNIGHLEGAAGIGGLFKAILSLETGWIFPTLNFEKPNPRLKLKEWNVEIATQLTPWPTNGTRRASVNSFGYGGSNAHVIVDDAYHYLQERALTGFTNTSPRLPTLTPTTEGSQDSGFASALPTSSPNQSSDYFPSASLSTRKLFVLSAPDQASLGRLSSTYSKYVDDNTATASDNTFLDNLAHTLGNRRSTFMWKQAVVAATGKELAAALSSSQPVRTAKPPRICLVFTGQGAQWAGMGRELLQHNVYLRHIQRADAFIKSLGAKWSVMDELNAGEDTSRINDPEFAQPLCTILQTALVELLAHWGVKPASVVGHSSGEIGAAFAAGSLTEVDAWTLSYYRGIAAKRISTVAPHLDGSMTAAGLSEEAVQKYITDLGLTSSVVVACINSPASVTLSGDASSLGVIEERLQADGVFNRRLKVSTAYHSPHMQHVAQQYKSDISVVKPRDSESGCAFYSSLTGTTRPGSSLDAEYWVQNMTEPVRFYPAVMQMLPDTTLKRRERRKQAAGSVDTFLEIGPAAALQGPLRQIIAANEGAGDFTLRSMLGRGKDATGTSLELMGKLWSLGAPIDFATVNDCSLMPSPKQVLCNTPRYPWNHATRYWHESAVSRNHRFPKAPRLDLLGAPCEEWNPSQPAWRNMLRISELPWIKEHMVHESIIFPGAGYICAVLEGARQIANPVKTPKQFELRDILIGRALEFDGETDVVELVTAFKPRKLGLKAQEAPWMEWTCYSNSGRGHIEHCSGLLFIHYEADASEIEGGREAILRNSSLAEEYRKIDAAIETTIPPADLYAKLASIGLNYGPLFQGMTLIKAGNGAGVTRVELQDTKAAMPMEFEYDHLLHPSTLDACFQSIFTAFLEQANQKLQAMVPTAIEAVRVSANLPKGAGSTLHGFAKGRRRGFREAMGSLYMSDESWTVPLVEVENIACTELGALTGGQASQETDALHKVQATWHWNVDPSMLTKDTAHELISMPQAEFDARVDSFVDLTIMGEKLAAIFGKRALQHMTKEEEENLSPHLKLYVEWLKSENEKASRGELQLQYGQNDWVTMTYEEEEEYIASLTNASIDAKLLIAVGRELNGILNGTVPPLTVMMQDNLLFDFYANAVGMDVSTDQIEKVFDLKAHQQPAMNILEIGAGTASISKPILQRLANHHGSTIRCSSYVFTDISSGFFEAAEKKLKEWANVVSYRRLDIEQDPIEQGFEAESFDVIAATNVLHATKNMNNTLQNVLKLLKPGGQLVLGEITFPRARLSMIYGTLSGWWLSEDGRTGGPCMTVDQWKDILTNNGFDFDYSIRDVPRDDIHLMSTICATKRSDNALPFKKTIIVTANDASPDVRSLVESLKSSLASDENAIESISIADVHKPAEEESSPFEGSGIISLLEIERPFLQNLDEGQLEAVQQVLLKSSASLWITRGDLLGENDPSFRLVDGLLRVIRNEDETLRVHSLDLPKTGNFSKATVISDWFKSVMIRTADTAETEVAYSDGKYLVPRLYDDTAKNYDLLMRNDTRPPVMQPLHQEGRPLRLTIGVPGMLDTVHWVDDESYSLPLEADEVEFSVRATAVNFVDLMISMGIVPDTLLGCDAAGVIVRVGSEVTSLQVGDKVACLGLGAHRNLLRSKAALCQKIPENMSFEDASTLPTIYVTAYQSLVEIGRLRKGETILIHAAAGGLGQAAIQLAQHIGAEIYATVGSVSKKELIMESYGIPETHIFNSRDMTFAQAVLRSTNGQGVDVVLNSLAGEALRKTWTCIKSFGRFIEVGKKDILGNSGLDMAPFLHNVTFAGVNVEGMFRNNKPLTAEISQKVFDLVRDGSVGVVHPITVYCVSEVEKAFRTMQQGKHSGKLVLSFDNKEAQVPVVPRDPHPLQLSPDVTYLLVGGLGGLGRAQAVWLAENGAKHIAFVSRSGASSDTAQQTMEKLKALDVDARAYPCDIAEPQKLADTLAKLADEMPRIAGVIQGAMVLSDSFFANMTLEQMNTALRPKVQGSWNLHDLLPKDLDFFIMLSSLAGVCGSRGQCNYAMGNTYQGALAAHRHQQGLKATVLDLGIMAGYGFVEENKDNAAIANLANSLGKLAIQPDEFFSILKSSITGYADGEIPMATHASLGAGTGGMVNAYKLNDGYDFYWHNNIPFSYIRHLDTLDTKALSGAGDEEFRAALQSAATSSEAVEVIQEALTAKLAKAMMIPLEDIDLSKPVSAYGVDSLVAVEVRNWISREMKSDLSVFDILSPIPMVQLANKIASKSSLLSAEYRAEAGKDAGDATEQAPPAAE